MKKRMCFGLLFLILSCDAIVDVEDISNRTVTILAPTEAAIVTQNNITFSWNSVEDAEQYKLQIATQNFENATQIIEDTTITTTNFNKTLVVGEYQWRVKGENANYETVFTTKTFVVE